MENKNLISINFCARLIDISSERLAKIYFKKAEIFNHKIKDYFKAKEFYTKAIDLKPDFEKAYLNYGYLLSFSPFRDYISAIEMFSIVITLNPKNKLAYFKRGSCKSNLNDYLGYLNDYNEYMKLTKIDSEVYFSRAIIKSRVNDYFGVIDDCTKSIELYEADSFKFFFRGKAKFNLKYYDDAIIDFKKAIEIEIEQIKLNNHYKPFYLPTLTYYGKAKFEKKDYEGSLVLFFKCLEQHPKNHYTYELIAKVYEKLNDFDNYKLYMEKFNELNEKKLENQSKTKSLEEIQITRQVYQERSKKIEELSSQILSSKQVEEAVYQMWLNHKKLNLSHEVIERHSSQSEKNVLNMSKIERIKLQAFKNVMERRQALIQPKSIDKNEEKRKYFSEVHKKNCEKVQAYIANSKTLPFTLEDDLKQQERNSIDKEKEVNRSFQEKKAELIRKFENDELTREEKLALKVIMENKKNQEPIENYDKKEEERKYFSEAHKKNSEGVRAYIAKFKSMEIDWEKELERQKRNSQDHDNSIKESLAGNISIEKTINTDLTEKKTPKFQSKAHEENYKKATAYIAKSKTMEIDWEKEIEIQKRNSQDHENSINEINIMGNSKIEKSKSQAIYEAMPMELQKKLEDKLKLLREKSKENPLIAKMFEGENKNQAK